MKLGAGFFKGPRDPSVPWPMAYAPGWLQGYVDHAQFVADRMKPLSGLGIERFFHHLPHGTGHFDEMRFDIADYLPGGLRWLVSTYKEAYVPFLDERPTSRITFYAGHMHFIRSFEQAVVVASTIPKHPRLIVGVDNSNGDDATSEEHDWMAGLESGRRQQLLGEAWPPVESKSMANFGVVTALRNFKGSVTNHTARIADGRTRAEQFIPPENILGPIDLLANGNTGGGPNGEFKKPDGTRRWNEWEQDPDWITEQIRSMMHLPDQYTLFLDGNKMVDWPEHVDGWIGMLMS